MINRRALLRMLTGATAIAPVILSDTDSVQAGGKPARPDRVYVTQVPVPATNAQAVIDRFTKALAARLNDHTRSVLTLESRMEVAKAGDTVIYSHRDWRINIFATNLDRHIETTLTGHDVWGAMSEDVRLHIAVKPAVYALAERINKDAGVSAMRPRWLTFRQLPPVPPGLGDLSSFAMLENGIIIRGVISYLRSNRAQMFTFDTLYGVADRNWPTLGPPLAL